LNIITNGSDLRERKRKKGKKKMGQEKKSRIANSAQGMDGWNIDGRMMRVWRRKREGRSI
jgi:hypothetical protein